MKPLLGYIRVSRVGARTKEDGFISPEIQEAAILKWAKAKNVEVIIMDHELNRSGGTMDRPIFNECMKMIAAGEAGGIVVYKMDRFSRSLLGAINTLGELGEHNAVLVSATEPEMDYHTPHGRVFMQMIFVFAEFLRSQLKDSWRVSQIQAITEKGIHIAPYGAFGYDKGRDKRLIPNDQAPLVVKAFQKRADEGWTWQAIADWLNEVAPLDEGRTWTDYRVQRMCARRVYLGEAFYGIVVNKEGAASAINRNAHPAIITDEDLFNRAQMNPAIAKGGVGSSESAALLGGGLVRCAGCRHTMGIATMKQGGVPYRIYKCRRIHTGGKCDAPCYISADRLESFVRSHVVELLDGLETEGVPNSSAIDDAQMFLDEAKEALAKFKENRRAILAMGEDEWNDWLEGYVGDVRQAERALRVASGQSNAGLRTVTAEEFLAASLDAQRGHIHEAIDYVVVRKPLPGSGRGRYAPPISDRALIFFKGDGPDDFPERRKFSGPIVPFDWPGDET